MSKSRVFLFVLLAFIGGVGSGSFFDISETAVLVIAIVAVSLAAVFYPIRGKGTLRALAASNGAGRRGSRILNFRIVLIVFLILTFSFGVLRFDVSESLTKVLTNFNDINSNVQVLGYVNDEPERLSDKQRLLLQVKEIRVPGYIISTDEKVLVTVNLYPEFEYGDLISAEGKLQSPREFNDFDYAAYLAKDGIFSVSYFPDIKTISNEDFFNDGTVSRLENLKISVFKNIFKVKKVFEESVERVVAEPNASFINGILLGSREGIPQELKDAFNKTGTTHLLAISGYNITVIALYVSALLIFFMRRQTAFWITVLAIAVFTVLTGASASVIRAAVMGILVMWAYREGRFYSMTNSIVFAGAAMIALNPKVLRFDVGFQLSFLATLGLIYLAPRIIERTEKIPEFLKLKESVITTVSAQAAVLPIILYNFKTFSPVSVLANALILPVVPLTMLFGFLAGILGLVWSRLGEAAGIIAWLLSGYEIFIAKLLS